MVKDQEPKYMIFSYRLFDGTDKNCYSVLNKDGEEIYQVNSAVENIKTYIDSTGIEFISLMSLFAIRKNVEKQGE